MTLPGIGASSIMGIAFEILQPPVLTSVTPGAGGALTAGAYRYAVTAIGPTGGETTISNEVVGTTSAGNLINAVLWAAVTGAVSYNIYRSAAGGGVGTELLLANVLAPTVTYNDAAVGVPTGTFPLISTASNPGVYVAPTKFLPYLTESLKYMQDTVWRRPVRATSGVVGAVSGNAHVAGDVSMEVLSDVIIYFLFASRCTVVKSGTGPFTYVYTPSANAIPARTLSITIVRNGIVFGYTGMVATDLKFSVNNGLLQFDCSMLGRDEAVQTAPIPTWPATTPYGAGSYNYQIPTATQVFDADTFEFASADNGQVNYRLRNTGRGAQFINFGESAATLKTDRDFINRTEYDAFKALTSQTITMQALKSASESITIAMPVAFKDTYEVNIGGQSPLVRATINYQGAIDGTGKHYQITCVAATENIV